MKLKFTKEELTTIRTLHNLNEEDESLHFKTNKEVKKKMEVMIRITTPRVFFDACPTDNLKSMRLKLKQGEIKWK
jgi:hypothetical protein